MEEEAFVAYVLSNAPRYEIEALEKIVDGLRDNIASRRWGKPVGLRVGSNIEATNFDTSFREYGTVVGMSESACIIEAAASDLKSRIPYQKYAIRILSDFEWGRVLDGISRWNDEYKEKRAIEERQAAEDRAVAIRDRKKAQKKAQPMAALNGTFELYRGAFVHAYRPDWGHHSYGIVVSMSPKKVYLSSEEDEWGSKVWVAKHEIEILSDAQWAIVDRELRRRRVEYDAAEKANRTRDLPDYSAIEIPLDE